MTTTTTGCQHPKDRPGERLLLKCPDCGAECSEIDVDVEGRGLCYDEECPLHVLAGPVVNAIR
jgi:hypothetical protein